MVNNNYILSISSGNYMKSVGGTDKVILSHQKMFNKSNISYAYIFPLNLMNSKPIKNNNYWGLIIDGKYNRVYSTNQLITFFIKLSKENKICNSIHIHHLRNIETNKLIKILAVFDCKIYMYIHDYYNICTSIKLLKDNNKLCSNDFLKKDECLTCKYYKSSKEVQNNFSKLIVRYKERFVFIAPSNAAKKWFLKQYPQIKDNIIVVFHQKSNGEYAIPKKKKHKIKIAYVGLPIEAKGWEQFKKLYYNYKNNINYEFIYFSSKKDESISIRNISVDFKTSLNAMIDALRKEQVDFALLWSIWPETYSYTYYESYISGCTILTNRNSGNIYEQVKKSNSGFVLSEAELIKFFDNYDNVLKIRKDYIDSVKKVPLNLYENDEIVELSTNKNTQCLDKDTNLKFNIISFILNRLYKLKYKDI